MHTSKAQATSGSTPERAAAVPSTQASATPGPARSPRARLRAWWQARLPLTDSWTLSQRNIYILPTRAGLAFALTLLLMLVAAVNYQLNLGYALTFLLAGAGLVSMHMTHGCLRGLTLHLRPPAPGHAGDATPLEIIYTNPGAARHGLALRFVDAPAGGAERHTGSWADVPAGGQETTHLSLVPPRRGWHAVPALVVETVFPFGLFRAWTLWRPAARVLAWPRPELDAPALPTQGRSPGDEQPTHRTAGGEMDGVRPWKRGDTMRQVVWKKVARSGEMVSRETVGSGSRELWLDWADAAVADPEQRLSRLAAWALMAEREGLVYGLRLPGLSLAPGQGDTHRRAVLEALALWR